MFMRSSRYIPFNNTLVWSAVVSCACDLILMFAVVFLLFGAVNKYYVIFFKTAQFTRGVLLYVPGACF
jgi:hypothetical protein